MCETFLPRSHRCLIAILLSLVACALGPAAIKADDDGTLRVALADKVHNTRAIVRDCRYEGHVVWERFTEKTAQQQLWYSRQLAEFFVRRRPGPLADELYDAVQELAALIAADPHETDPPYRPE